MTKNRPQTKKSWDSLYAAARAEAEAREEYYRAEYFNGVSSPRDIMDFALENANDTFAWNESHPDFWRVAFGSIYQSAEAYGVTDAVAPFFKANKWTF